jgi:hypothetical protein
MKYLLRIEKSLREEGRKGERLAGRERGSGREGSAKGIRGEGGRGKEARKKEESREGEGEEDVESEEVQHVENYGRGDGWEARAQSASPLAGSQEGRTDGVDSDCDKDTQMVSYTIRK